MSDDQTRRILCLEFNLHCLVSGLSLLKVGGRMIYSTCSMNPIENEAVVAEVIYSFLSSFSVNMILLDDDLLLVFFRF